MSETSLWVYRALMAIVYFTSAWYVATARVDMGIYWILVYIAISKTEIHLVNNIKVQGKENG